MSGRLTSIAVACAATPTFVHAADRPITSTPCYGSTKDWRAWIEQGATEPELVVAGIVTTPTGGSWNVLTLGRTPWDEPARQIVSLEIRGMSEIVTAAVTTEEVRGRFRLPPHFRGPSGTGTVIIECNGKEVGRTRATRVERQAR
jgi:hypothetical protein